LAVADNRSSQVSLDWDTETLKGLVEDGVDLAPFWTADELAAMWPQDGAGDGNASQTLAERFGVPPFSVLDARQGYWQERKKAWLSLGIQSEIGRGGDSGMGAAVPGEGGQRQSTGKDRHSNIKGGELKAASRMALHDSAGYSSPLQRKKQVYDARKG
jgi:hypothetical protein